jgi:hypothetical protein
VDQQDDTAHQYEDQEQHEPDEVENQPERGDDAAKTEALKDEQDPGEDRNPPLQGRAPVGRLTSWALCSQRFRARPSSCAWALGATTFSSSMYTPVRAAASSDRASQTSERAPRSGERKKGTPSVATTFQIPFSFLAKPVRTTRRE